MSRLGRALAAAVLISALAPLAAEATVTVGSSLSRTTNAGYALPQATVWVQDVLPADYRQSSSVNGTVVLWRVRGTFMNLTPNTLQLRVLQSSGAEFIGAGSSDPQTLPNDVTDDVVREFTTSIPIHPGDRIGVSAVTNAYVPAATAEGMMSVYNPFNDGSRSGSPTAVEVGELQVSAEVEPTNTISLSRPRTHKKKGTATITVNVPNPGELTGSGNGAKVSSAAVTSKSVGAGQTQLLIKAKGRKKRKLNDTGKVKLNVAITYTPTGGTSSTQSVKVKLKKKL